VQASLAKTKRGPMNSLSLSTASVLSSEEIICQQVGAADKKNRGHLLDTAQHGIKFPEGYKVSCHGELLV